MTKKYDVIVAGGGTAGCACAYTAAKLGLKTLLIEKNSFLGGSITSSLVIPAMKTSDNAINTDFFNVFYNELEKIGGAITYSDGNKGWYNPELSKIVLDKLMISKGVDILFEHEITHVEERLKHDDKNSKKDIMLSSYIVTIRDNNTSFYKKELLPHIETKYIVDATADAKICQILNYKFLENENKIQPSSLRFIMSGVNTKLFANWIMELDKNRDVTTACEVDGNTYLSTAYTWDKGIDWALRPLFENAIKNNELTEADCNYFQLFSIAGTSDSIAFNAPRIVETGLTRTQCYLLGRQRILKLSQFCKKYLKGFENAYISSIANTLGVRVSNRVKCKYVYTKNDLECGKKFKNPVLISNYPIDIHSSKKDGSTLKKMQEYQLPIEALQVDERLFVAGRSLSADFEAQAALRIIPSCFAMGEGVAKYIHKQLLNN